MKTIRLLLFCSIWIAGVTAGSHSKAEIIFSVSPGGGNPDENLVFNKTGLVVASPTAGDPVQGATNQTHAVLDITGSNMVGSIVLEAIGGQGQAHVEQQGGIPFNGAMFTPHMQNDLPAGLNPLGGFNDFKFNINATADGSVTIEAFGLNSAYAILNASLDGNGENFFRIIADSGDVITKVTVLANGNIIQEFKQIRLGGLTGPTGPIDAPPFPDPEFVPEPASVLVWGMLAIAGAAARFRRRRG